MIFNWTVVSLEIASGVMALALLVLGMVFPALRTRNIFGGLSIAGLLMMLAGSFLLPQTQTQTFINSFYTQDAFSIFFKQLFIGTALLVSLLSLSYLKPATTNRGDFFALIFFALTGMMMMASAVEFVTLYVGLELMTLTFVLLTAYKKEDLKSGEAGLKYCLLSAVSSGVFLYGISLVYGLTGHLDFTSIAQSPGHMSSPLLIWAIVMVLAGAGFKISLVPFHMWSPDIYEGAPAPVSAFLAAGSKAAGFVVLIRMLFQVFGASPDLFMPIIATLAVLTLVIGNLIAVAQTHLKRLIAYSSIAHAGYIILGVIAYSATGVGTLLYYLLLYLFATTACFSVVVVLARQTGNDRIADLSGLWKRSPFTSSVLLISLLSLAGIPPTAGFMGKFYLFTEVARQGYLWLAVFAIMISLVAIYYYLLVIRTALSGSGADQAETSPLQIPLPLATVMVLSSAMTLIMGIFPGYFIHHALNIAQKFMGG